MFAVFGREVGKGVGLLWTPFAPSSSSSPSSSGDKVLPTGDEIKAAPELHARSSRVDLHGNDGQNHVLIPPANHYAQVSLLLDGGADVGRRGDPLSIDGDDDVVLFEAATGQGRGVKRMWGRVSTADTC